MCKKGIIKKRFKWLNKQLISLKHTPHFTPQILKSYSRQPPLPYLQGTHSPAALIPIRILNESRQHLAPRLQERVAHDNLEESLQSFPSVLNNVV